MGFQCSRQPSIAPFSARFLNRCFCTRWLYDFSFSEVKFKLEMNWSRPPQMSRGEPPGLWYGSYSWRTIEDVSEACGGWLLPHRWPPTASCWLWAKLQHFQSYMTLSTSRLFLTVPFGDGSIALRCSIWDGNGILHLPMGVNSTQSICLKEDQYPNPSGTISSQAISHPSAFLAQSCWTSVYPTWPGHWHFEADFWLDT